MFNQDSENQNQFQSQLVNMKSKYGEEKTWHVTRFDAFKMETERMIRKLIDGNLEITWEKILANTDNPRIKLLVRSLDYGSLSTEISWLLLHDERCPKDLPRQLAMHFKNKMGIKIDKLKKLLIKHEGALKQMEEEQKIEKPTYQNKKEEINETYIESTPEITKEVVPPEITSVPEIKPDVDFTYDDLTNIISENNEIKQETDFDIKEEKKKIKKKNKK